MTLLDNIKLEDILFLDIETVPGCRNYSDMNEDLCKLWDKKAGYFLKNDEVATPADYYDRAGIYAEFGKIVCISVGYITGVNGSRTFRSKSFYGDDERQLLSEFIDLLNSHYNTDRHLLCAHNGKEFDYPYMARRMLINNLKLPRILDIAGKKPWEVKLLDTMELWKFGDYKNYTSISLLANIFNIPTPKDDIDGSQVCKVYWEDNDLERIVTYCQKDVLTVAQLLLRFKGEDIITPENVMEI